MWSKILYDNDLNLNQNGSLPGKNTQKLFTEPLAAGLYQDILHLSESLASDDSKITEFSKLSESEKKIWYKYADVTPGKLIKLDLFIRPFKDYCRTCIITDSEIESLVKMDYEHDCRDLTQEEIKGGDALSQQRGVPSVQHFLKNRIKDQAQFYKELNLLIPVQLKKIGYEVIRKEEITEIDISTIKKLARAIHAKYLHDIRTQRTGFQNDSGFYIAGNGDNTALRYAINFDDLPADIKYSNLDNATHIPTKLLSIGYKIRPVKKGYKSVALSLDEEEVETMARVEHIRWCWEKRLGGWKFGKIKDPVKKTHPSLVDYEELDESEKDKDRELVKLIPAFLHDLSFEAYPISPSRIKKLSYAIKPQSSIHKLLSETRKMTDEISSLALASPEIKGKILSINNKIEEILKEVQGSYNYARHIQEIFLPEDFYIRECFPESFVLFKPKNIVSGDFYFFSKLNEIIIFALADCTGHGIPGALISTIGYGTLDQVVNVKKITEPTRILRQLYSSVHRFMRRNIEGHSLEDDMDITTCLLDSRTNLLTVSGVGNLIYHCSKGKIEEIKLGYFKDDCNVKQEYLFTQKNIQMADGDTLYLCSDGYADQFGGRNHKKYQRKRLMNFLLKIQDQSMPEQNDLLYEEIERWREENDEEQTDDISIIGIRI
jgi:serine phosphatase RsbU (regulator of sigma subunit)